VREQDAIAREDHFVKVEWRLVIAVAIGGAIGSVARYLLGSIVQNRFPFAFPLGTLLINVAGSFLLGLFMQVGLDTRVFTPEMRFFLTTGFCGGFTTFSTFSYETVRLIEEERYRAASGYVGASVILSIMACFLGVDAARRLLAARRSSRSSGDRA
jgi:fluoride exporter